MKARLLTWILSLVMASAMGQHTFRLGVLPAVNLSVGLNDH